MRGPAATQVIKWSAFDMEMTFHSRANKTHFHEKGCAIGLILKVKVFGTRKLTLKDLGRSSKMTSSG